MKCHNCGNEIKNNPYCPSCGTKTNILPRNLNFLFVLLVLFSIMVLCAGYLLNYYRLNDYKVSIKYNDYKIYYPIGFKTKTESKNNIDGNKCAYIYDSTTSYELCSIKAKYKSYLLLDYKYIKESFAKEGYEILDISEYNDKLLLIKIKGEKKNNYIYVYDLDENSIMSGYFVTNNTSDKEDIERLNIILSKITK